MTRPRKDFVVMERETHNHNNDDQHIIDIDLNDDDSSSGSSLIYSSARTSPSTDDNDDTDQHIIDTPNYGAASSTLSQFTDEETSDEGSSTIGWNSMELVFAVVQIVAALVVWTIAKDEHPQALLSAWLIVYTCGCIADMLLLSWAIYNLVREYPGTRVGRVMDELKIWLGCFFVVWSILGILWICFGHSSPSDAPNLYRLCVAFIAFSCIRFSAAILLLLCEGEGLSQGGGFVFQGPITDDCCCICLEKYGGKDKVIRKLECSHIFHSDCVDKWLIVKSTCPLCQSLVGG